MKKSFLLLIVFFFILIFFVLISLISTIVINKLWHSPDFNALDEIDFVDYYGNQQNNTVVFCSADSDKVIFVNSTGINIANYSVNSWYIDVYCGIKAFTNSSNAEQKNLFIVDANYVYVIDGSNNKTICTSALDSAIAGANGQTRLVDINHDGKMNEIVFTGDDYLFAYNETCGQIFKTFIGLGTYAKGIKVANFRNTGYIDSGVFLNASSGGLYKKAHFFNSSGGIYYNISITSLTSSNYLALEVSNAPFGMLGPEVILVYSYAGKTNYTIYNGYYSTEVCRGVVNTSVQYGSGESIEGDFDNDGNEDDLAFAVGSNVGSSDKEIVVEAVNTMCDEDILWRTRTGVRGEVLDMGYFDIDGGSKEIFISTNNASNSIIILDTTGNLLGTLQTGGSSGSSVTSGASIKHADLNLDGYQDLVISVSSNDTEAYFVDKIGPSVNIIYPQNINYSTNISQLNYTVSDNIGLSKCWNSNSTHNLTYVTAGTNFSDIISIEGVNNWTVWCNDTGNNIGSANVSFLKDTTKPSITFFSPTNTTYRDRYYYNESLQVISTDSGVGVISQYWYSLNSGTNTTFSPNTTLTSLVAGNNNLTVWVNDSLNNIGSSSVSFNLTFTPRIGDINISNSSINYRLNNNSDLIGWWKLDKNWTIQEDSSGLALNGTVKGNPYFTSNGVFGGGYFFNSSSYNDNITIGDTIGPVDTVSFSLWFNPSQNLSLNGVNQLFARTTRLGLWFYAPTKLLAFEAGNSTCGRKWGEVGLATVKMNNSNQWYYLVGSYNASHILIYVDSVLKLSSRVGTYTLCNDASSLTLGSGVNGTLDDVRIYNHSLSQQEINYLYNQRNTVFPEYPNVTIVVNVTDEDTPQSNLYYEWFIDSVSVLAGLAQNVFNWIFTGRQNIVRVVVNDTYGYNVTQIFNISTTFVNATISFVTPLNNSNQSSTSVLINITGSEPNLNKAWVDFDSTNYSMSCTGGNTSLLTYYCNVTVSGLSDGIHNYTAYANDSVGNRNNTNRFRMRVDTTAPTSTASATSPPGGSTYTFNTWAKENVKVTISAFDSGVGYNNLLFPVYCTDTTNSCNPNTFIASGVTVSTEGTSYIRYYSNDTLNNKETTQSGTIKIDTIKPFISILYPPNTTNTTSTGLDINYTYSDGGSGINQCKWTKNNGITNTTLACGTNLTSETWAEGINNITIYTNDSAGNENSSSIKITIDTIYPLITFNSQTITNNSNMSHNWIFANISFTEANPINVSFRLFNSTHSLNYSNYSATWQINWTGLSDESYYYNVTIVDVVNQRNTTERRKITLDTTLPSGTLLTPENNTYTDTTSQNLSVNITDNYLYNTTLNIINSTGNTINQTTTNITGTNTAIGIIYTFLYDGIFKWFYRIFDFASNSFNTQNNTITIDTTTPLIVYSSNSEIDSNNITRNNIFINVTITESNPVNITFALYNSTGEVNLSTYTMSTQTSNSSINWTDLPDESYYYNVTIIDILSKSNSTITRNITVDTTSPEVTIFSPLNTTYRDIYTYNYSLQLTALDLGSEVKQYNYSLNGATNVTFTPNITISGLTVGSNTLKLTVQDYATNLNITTIIFYLAFTPKITNINVSNSTIVYSRNNLTDGLIGFWKLDENNTNQTDSSSNSNTGVVVGARFNLSGIIGGAYQFDGSDKITINDITSYSYLNRTNAYSITAWANSIKMISASSSNLNPSIMEKWDADGSYPFAMRYLNSSGKISCSISNGTVPISVSSNNDLTNKNSLITCVYNKSDILIYIDGVYNTKSSYSSLTGDVANTKSIWLGSRGGSQEYFNGTIDEVRIYNRSLSSDEVWQIYSLTNPTFPEYSNVTFNVTVNDEDTSSANIFYTWYVDTVSVLAGLAQNVFNWVFLNRNNIVTVKINDTNNYQVNQTWNISTTFLNPTINFTFPTPTNNTYQTSTYIFVNITGTEANVNDSWVTINNTNYTMSCSGNVPYFCYYNFSASDNFYNYTAYIRDKVANINNTERRIVTVDSINPQINLTYPFNTTYTTIPNSINFTRSDTNINTCWYSTDGGTTNVSNPTCTNITGLSASQGSNIWLVAINDSANSKNMSKVIFFVDSINPLIDFTDQTESSGTYLNRNNIQINVTSSDTNLKNITIYLYNSTALFNTTNTTTSPNFINYTNLIDGLYYFNSTARDGLNQNSTETRNVTVDTTNPLISYGNNNAVNKANLSQSFVYINLSITEINFKNMSYNIYNSSNFIDYTGLVGYWNFDSNTTSVYDQSGNSNTGTNNNATWNASGKIGGAYQFDGNNASITVTNENLLENENALTFSVWLSPSYYKRGGIVGDRYQAKDVNWTQIWTLDGDNILVACHNGTSQGNYVLVENVLEVGIWKNLVGIFNSTGIYFYINGVLNNSVASVFCMNRNRTNIYYPRIGNYYYTSGTDGYFNGTIDEVMIFNRTLSATEISNLYNRSLINHTEYTTQTNSINFTNLNDGYYSYFADILDLANNYNSTEIRNILLDTNNPSATLVFPTNNTFNSTTSQNFTASLTDNLGIRNSTLYIYNETAVFNETTTTYSPNTIESTLGVIIILVDQVYKWYVRLFDWAGNNYTTQNNTLTIDSINPQISYDSSTYTNATWRQTGDIFINITASDTNKNIVKFQFNSINETFDNSNGDYYWENKTGLSTGNYTVFAWINDTTGNMNITRTYFYYLDLENPTVTILYPEDLSTENINTSVNLNFTATDTNLQSCWYNFDNGANNSISCVSGELTGVLFNISEGSHNVTAFANDSSGRVGSHTHLFSVNLAPPGIVVSYPANNLWINHTQNITFNYTATDSDGISYSILWGNFTGTWSLNQTDTPTSGVEDVFFINLTDNSYIWNIWVNDSGNNAVWAFSNNYTLNIDSVKPLISYVTGTEVNNFNATRNWIYAETSNIETNFKNQTFNLYSSSDLLNSTLFTSTGGYSSFDGTNDYIKVNNLVLNNTNITISAWVKLNNITAVQHIVWSGSSNGDGWGTDNETHLGFSSNTTSSFFSAFSNGADFCRVDVPNININQWYYLALVLNDTSCSIYLNGIFQTKDTFSGIKSLSYLNYTYVGRPGANSRYFNGSLEEVRIYNRTLSDSEIQEVYNYGRFNEGTVPSSVGLSLYLPFNNDSLDDSSDNHLFTTSSGVTIYHSNKVNWTGLSDGVYYYNTTIIDKANNKNWTETRNITLDNIAPSLTVYSPTNISYLDNYYYNVSLFVTSSDSGIGISKYWYSLNEGENVSFTPNSTLSNLIAGTNNVTIWVNDSLNNQNSSFVNFSLKFTPKINNINISNSTVSYSRNNLTTGLVGWWKFDKNWTVQEDSSGNGNNGTVINATFNYSGIIGGAYNFAGTTQYMTSTITTITTPYSVAFWYKPSATPSQIISILSLKGGQTNPYIATANPGRLLMYYGPEKYRYTPSNVIVAGNWYHVVAVTNGTNVSQMHIYINGILRDGSVGADTGTYYEPTTSLVIGNSNLNNLIDEVRLYNRSLSSDEVWQLYSLTNPTFPEYTNVTINATITDEDTSSANLYYQWFVDSVSVLTGFAQNIFNYIFIRPNQQVQLIVNDTDNCQVNQTWNITTTFINPTINYTYPTQGNYTYLSNSTFTINFTGTEYNLNKAWITLNNTNYSLNCRGGNSSVSTYLCNYTFTLSDGIYNYTAYINDSVGNRNNTERRILTLDTTYPTISYDLGIQVNNANLSQNWIFINSSITETNFKNMSYYLYNSSNFIDFTGLVGYWNFDSNTTTIYDKSNRHNNAIVVGAKFNSSGRVGGSCEFDGSDYLDLGDNIDNQINNSFSFSLWMYEKKVTVNAGVIGLGDSSNRQLWLYTNNPTITFSVYTFNPNHIDMTIGLNEWTHIAGTFNGTFMRFYKNGVESINLTYSGVFPTGSNNNYLGYINGFSYFNGTLDEVMILNRTLSPSEISDIYNRTLVNHTEYTTQTDSINFTNLNDGYYSYFADILDLANNYNSTEIRNILLDTNNPSATLTFPTNNTFNSTTTQNFTASLTDNLGIKNSTLYIYNQTDIYNITTTEYSKGVITSTLGVVITLSDGVYQWFVKLFDWVGNNYTTQNNTLNIDSVNPSILITYPSSGDYLLSQSFSLLFSISDTNIDSCWYSTNSTMNVSIGCSETSLSLNLLDNPYTVTIYANDTTNNFYSTSVSFTVDSTPPSINFISPTQDDDENVSASYVIVNTSYTETNFASVTFRLLNSSFVNSTLYSTEETQIIFNDVSDGSYNYSVIVNDLAGNSQTLTRRINLDTTSPIINIASPLSQNYANNNSLSLNYTVTDNFLGVKECWYYVYNSSGSLIVPTTTLANCDNDTVVLPGGDIDYTLTLFAYDNINNLNSQAVSFGIRTNSPAIVLSPVNDTQSNTLNNHLFNFTVSTNTAGISQCQLWGNFTGTWSLNQTDTSISTSSTNSFNQINMTENLFIWNVWCNDSLNNYGWAFSNISYITDITYPEISINPITTTPGSQTIFFTVNATDVNTLTCKYSIYDSLGNINGLNNNVSFDCVLGGYATVTSFGTYNLTTYAKDKAGNENSSTRSFTVAVPTTPGSGGAGNPPITSESSAIAIIQPPNTTLQSDLVRAILYARISEYCNNQTGCTINYESNLFSVLVSQNANVSDFSKWLEYYNQNNLETVKISDTNIEKYNLFTKILQIQGTPLQIRPPRMDRFWIVNSRTFSEQVLSNKVLKNCSIVNGEIGWSCTVSESTATISFTLENFPPDWFSRVITSKISYTDIDNKNVFQDVNIRAINLRGFFTSEFFGIPSYFLLILAGLLISITFIYRKNIKSKFFKRNKPKKYGKTNG